MARVTNVDRYQARKNEILDVAQELVMVTKGYAEMSIQDILDALGISKGAFYHYFDSKQSLLEALIERIITEATPMIMGIIDDPDLPAMQKLHRFFHQTARWKTARKDYLLSFLHVWYADENAITREKLRLAAPERFGPMLTTLIEQGIEEGVFETRYPDQVGRVIMDLIYEMGVQFALLLKSRPQDPQAEERAVRMVDAFNDAVERVIGAAPGSLELMEPDVINAWFEPEAEPVFESQAPGR
jgi:TetR/AcrR family transcriptional repressor of nem operon